MDIRIINCPLCGRVHKVEAKGSELCYECQVMHEALYKVTIHRIERLLNAMSLRQINQKISHDPQRVQIYVAHRFKLNPRNLLLNEHRRGHCYICNIKVFVPEAACLDCLQRVQATLEERDLSQLSRMGTGQRVQFMVPRQGVVEAPTAESRWPQEALEPDETNLVSAQKTRMRQY